MADPVRAAGAVLWREWAGGVEVALVHRPRYNDWSLPKGKLDAGEPAAVAACREVLEETGFDGPLGRGLGTTSYDVVVDDTIVRKTVRWWSLEAVDGSFVPSEEVDELRWLPACDAVQRLGAERDADPLTCFLSTPARTTTVLLVRHADAGDPSVFDGPDAQRPLDAEGLRQAAELAKVLPLWRPVRVLSAPPLRCLQTVEPLGLPVEVEPAFGEQSWNLPGARKAVTRLVAAGAPVVICSQGGAIPDLVADLTGSRQRVRAKKGSVWALTFAAGALVDADYTAALP